MTVGDDARHARRVGEPAQVSAVRRLVDRQVGLELQDVGRHDAGERERLAHGYLPDVSTTMSDDTTRADVRPAMSRGSPSLTVPAPPRSAVPRAPRRARRFAGRGTRSTSSRATDAGPRGPTLRRAATPGAWRVARARPPPWPGGARQVPRAPGSRRGSLPRRSRRTAGSARTAAVGS